MRALSGGLLGSYTEAGKQYIEHLRDVSRVTIELSPLVPTSYRIIATSDAGFSTSDI